MNAMTMAPALRILSHFWLEEIGANDIALLAGLPHLAETLPELTPETITDLAVAYQRLFGFNVPPYESVFVDPTVMLQAPATSRVLQLYQQGGWAEAPHTRAGAVDHLGVELLALADWLEAGQTVLAHQLLTDHLTLWLPSFVLTLRRLAPNPFYTRLGDLTLDLVLTLLSDVDRLPRDDPFPELPPPPVFRASDDLPDGFEHQPKQLSPDTDQPEAALGLRQIIKRLLPPCQAGLFITREDCAHIGQGLHLAGTMGDRYRLLETLFQQAGQYELVSALLDALLTLLETEQKAYQQIVAEYPAWQPYATAWQTRIEQTKTMLADLKAVSLTSS